MPMYLSRPFIQQHYIERPLELAWGALRPGGWTLIRQLNSVLDIPGLGRRFNWHTAEANDLHARDRSFFYRALHLGSKS